MEEYIDIQYKSLQLRKSLLQMLAASIVIRPENGAPVTTPILLEGGLFQFRGGKALNRGSSHLLGLVVETPLEVVNVTKSLLSNI